MQENACFGTDEVYDIVMFYKIRTLMVQGIWY